jgi:NADH-quinone oxidoreductase subunit F
MIFDSRQKLDEARKLYQKALVCEKKQVIVCGGATCLASGAQAVYNALKASMEKNGVNMEVTLQKEEFEDKVGLKKSGCCGFCAAGPLVHIEPAGILYTKVTPEDADEIIKTSVMGDDIVERLVYRENGEYYPKMKEVPFYKPQKKVAFDHCGEIEGDSLEEYIAVGGYEALEKALFDMTPEQIIEVVTDANLRGRGGAGFPAGRKWSQVAAHKEAPIRYVVCNGDEGDPGAFMDRSMMEDYSHRLIEGIIICAVACDATEGYIYVRAEYPMAVKRLKKAIALCEEAHLLGDDILGTGRSFHLHLSKGAGAFVCGEGSALANSVEGKRGMPRPKPPRLVDCGVFNAPTVLNNVETFACVAPIINNGAEWFTSIGTPNNSGTKVFALAGNIAHTGLIEVPMGTTLREIVFNIGGGVRNGTFKAVQIGGPSGGCLTEAHLDLPLDFDSIKRVGAIIGSGGLVVMGDDTCMVEIARFFMNFVKNESCGKCTPCRDGVPEIYAILDRITKGKGTLEDLDVLQELSDTIKNCALCGLGKTATNPVMSTLRYFREEYVSHVRDKKCPAGVCKDLFVFQINPEKCIGCTKCARNCPVDAITGSLKQPHHIDTDKCIKCGTCKAGCPQDAVEEV